MRVSAIAILLLSGLSETSLAANDFVGSIQGYYQNKSYSIDESSQTEIMGVYSYLGYGKHSLEAEVDTLTVKDDPYSQQEDFTVLYSNYQLDNWQLKLGLHNIGIATPAYYFDESDNQTYQYSETEEVTAVILGAHYSDYYYSYKVWELGIDAINARYKNDPYANFMQFSPHYTHYFSGFSAGHYYQLGLTLHTQFYEYNVRDKFVYINPEINVKYVMSNTSFSLTGQFGENVNQFNLGGFAFNGDNLIYTQNINFTMSYSFTSTFFVKAAVEQQSYISAIDTKEKMNIAQLTLGFNF